MKQNVSLDYQLKGSIEKVWRALTDSTKLENWVMRNDFKPIVGHQFQFRTEPTQWWNGIVDCEVLEIDEPHQLSYTWVSGSEQTIVTWTLSERDGVTHLHLEQTGFKGEPQAVSGAKYGWERMLGQLAIMLEA